MASYHTLAITGYRDLPVPHTFIEQETPADRLTVVLPGIGYTSHMPLLYYPTILSLDAGADVLRLEYEYVRQKDFMALDGAGRKGWLTADVTAACRAALDRRPYGHVTLIGKSLGTRAMGHLFGAEPRLARAAAVWLTPILRSKRLCEEILEARPRSLFVAGTADPHHDKDALETVRNAIDGEALIIDEADHSLEIPGDLPRSIRMLEEVVRALQSFLAS